MYHGGFAIILCGHCGDIRIYNIYKGYSQQYDMLVAANRRFAKKLLLNKESMIKPYQLRCFLRPGIWNHATMEIQGLKKHLKI